MLNSIIFILIAFITVPAQAMKTTVFGHELTLNDKGFKVRELSFEEKIAEKAEEYMKDMETLTMKYFKEVETLCKKNGFNLDDFMQTMVNYVDNKTNNSNGFSFFKKPEQNTNKIIAELTKAKEKAEAELEKIRSQLQQNKTPNALLYDNSSQQKNRYHSFLNYISNYSPFNKTTTKSIISYASSPLGMGLAGISMIIFTLFLLKKICF